MASYINQQNSDADKQVKLRFPKGVDQVSPETSLLAGAARRLVNLDVHQGTPEAGGRVSARSQVQRIISGTDTHSLWSGDSSTCYVDNGSLYLLDQNTVPALIRSGMGSMQMYYVEIAGTVYYSNGAVTGTILNGATSSWGLPIPVAPDVLAIGFGGLAAGDYVVAYTYIDATGRESGATQVSGVAVVAGGGIQLSAPPTSMGYTTRVYVSPPNGENLYWSHNIPAGAAISYVGTHQPGKLLTTQHMQPMPACTHLESYNGRIYAAVGNILIATQALNYDLTRPATDFVVFPDPITMIASVDDGVYVGTQHGVTYLEGDDLPLFKVHIADMLPPIEGSDLAVDGSLFGDAGEGIVWLTRRGWVYASAGGKVKRLTEAQMALPQYDRAASMYREHDGMRQLVSFVKGGGEAAGASDSYDVEIVRNGRLL